MVDKTSPTRVDHEALAALGTCDKVGILRRRIMSKASAAVGVCCRTVGGDEEAEIRGVGPAAGRGPSIPTGAGEGWAEVEVGELGGS